MQFSQVAEVLSLIHGLFGFLPERWITGPQSAVGPFKKK